MIINETHHLDPKFSQEVGKTYNALGVVYRICFKHKESITCLGHTRITLIYPNNPNTPNNTNNPNNPSNSNNPLTTS